MKSKLLSIATLFSTCMVPFAAIRAADLGQNVSVRESVKIPGASLKPGTYNFAVEDRLADRAVVRISNTQDTNEHYLLLAVPNSKLVVKKINRLLYFGTASGGEQSLKAWKCASCAAPLELVYPKLEAVKITDDSTEAVMAVDPSYDKLPANLSADDMKVVTLWLLSPERITAENVGQGVKAVKYSPETNPAAGNQVAQDTASAATTSANAPVETASATNPGGGRHRLPKTAGNTYLFGFYGLVCLAGAFILRMKRRKNAYVSR